jgi:ATP-dependent RNA helicase DeaD
MEITSFDQLGLSAPLLKSLTDLGYEAPTPIQAQTIPALRSGRDLIGQAQTGTGKTAAFALPMLDALDLKDNRVQGLILTPTRELAIQVSEALHTYARHMGQVSVLPIYGGQPFPTQLRRLQQGVHVVVGTPGRVMDHMRRGSLKLDHLKILVLDEADEMLRMGFQEDVEWILAQTPATRQTALFTATMPPRIRTVAKNYLRDPLSIEVAHKTRTVSTVSQFYMNVSFPQKLEALAQLLNWEPVDSALVFTRTKTGAQELAQKLVARGIPAEPLHGDMSQAQREQLIRRLRNHQIDVVIATDVAARGLDVEHISHVFNYDIPSDVEVYVHRIGRTGRAGRSGVAVLFVMPRERSMLKAIEAYTGSRMTPMKVPTRADMAARTLNLFKESVTKTLAEEGLETYLGLVEEIADEGGFDIAEVAAAVAKIALGDKQIAVSVEPEPEDAAPVEEGMVRLFLSAGSKVGVRPSDVVGAIANEAGVPGKEIGAIDINERYTLVEIPLRHKDKVLSSMAKSVLRGRPVEVKLAFPEQTGERADQKSWGKAGGAKSAGKKPYAGKASHPGKRASPGKKFRS